MKKKMIFLTLLFLQNGFSNWERVDGFSKKVLCRTVFFTDTLRGWIGGHIDSTTEIGLVRGYVAYTEDGGKNWDYIPTGSNLATVGSIYFADQKNGWITGYTHDEQGAIFKTTDGGHNWEMTHLDSAYYAIHKIVFPTPEIGYYCSLNDKHIGKSIDSGGNWDIKRYSIGYFEDLFFLNKDTGWAVGEYAPNLGFVSRTLDGGKTWEDLIPDGDKEIFHIISVFFLDENVGWVGGDNQTIAKTVDGGITWKNQYEDNSKRGYCVSGIHFVNKVVGWAITWTGTVLFTQDAGENWDKVELDTTKTLDDIHFVGPNHGWIVGQDGTLFRTTDNGGYPQTVAVKTAGGHQKNSSPLLKAVSSRSNGYVDLMYAVNVEGNVSIKLYNLQGKKITSLVNKFQESGNYRVPFSVAHGSYIVKVTVNGEHHSEHTQKLIIQSKM